MVRLEALSNSDSFIDVDVMTWDYKDSNKNNKSNNIIINKTVLREVSKYLCFIFDQAMHQQIDGVSMDSPLYAILANVFSCQFEKCVMFFCQSHLNGFVNYIDTKNSNIKYN